MKEKSKTAAKSRREKENSEFSELARLLPLPWAIASQLDKASVIRLTCSYLNLRSLFPNGLQSYISPTEFFEFPEIVELGSQLMQTLEGFVFIIGLDGRVIYISETASAYLGLSQVELTGNNIFEYLHPADQPLMADVLQKDLDIMANLGDPPSEYEVEKSFTIRLRCILAKRNAGLTYHGHKVVHCTGFVKFKLCRSVTGAPTLQHVGLVAMGSTLPANSATEYKLPSTAFLLRMSLDFKIRFLDARVNCMGIWAVENRKQEQGYARCHYVTQQEGIDASCFEYLSIRVAHLTGYDPQELLDHSLYSYVHAFDVMDLRESHKDLLEKCQAVTGYYRFLGKNGVWIWMQSQLALIHNARSSRPHCIVCVSHVISHDTSTMDASALDTCRGARTTYPLAPNKCPKIASSLSTSSVGAYSEQFYGPHGVLLMTTPSDRSRSRSRSPIRSRTNAVPIERYPPSYPG